MNKRSKVSALVYQLDRKEVLTMNTQKEYGQISGVDSEEAKGALTSNPQFKMFSKF